MRVSLDQLRQRVVDEIYVLSIFEVRNLQKVIRVLDITVCCTSEVMH